LQDLSKFTQISIFGLKVYLPAGNPASEVTSRKKVGGARFESQFCRYGCSRKKAYAIIPLGQAKVK
jgi:hypothetical protein